MHVYSATTDFYMPITYIASCDNDPVCDAVESLLSKNGDVVRVTPKAVGDLRPKATDCLVVGMGGAEDAYQLDLLDFGLVQFAGCRPPGPILEIAASGRIKIAGISPVISQRVANRVTGFTGPLPAVPVGDWGVVGLGTVGTDVARRAVANRSKVSIAEIRTPRSGILSELGVRRNSLDLLVAGSDVVTLHVHAGPTASPLISERELKLMKSDAVLINTSDTSVVDELAVEQALRSGDLSGYATDCPGPTFETPEESLVSAGKLVVTTNPLTNQIGAPQQIARFIETNLKAFQNGGQIQGLYEPVDFPVSGDPSFWSSRMSPRQD